MRYLSADYVFPVNAAPVANGVLVTDHEGRVMDLLDPATDDCNISGLERFNGFLCPGFINAHCHLELSWMKGRIEPGKGLDSFLKQLETLRKEEEEGTVLSAVSENAERMLKSGIVAAGDISNSPLTASCKSTSGIRFHTFCEVFASDPAKAGYAFSKAETLFEIFRGTGNKASVSIVPHATYSLSPELFRLVAGHGKAHRSILSIHHMESAEEIRYFSDGSGSIGERRRFFNPELAAYPGTGKRPLESIAGELPAELPFLFVHNTYSTDLDIGFALNQFRDPYWCFCPNANLYIENKLPEVELFRRAGCKITLGTDSLASNHSLSVLEEIKVLGIHFPEIPLREKLAWATVNGAEFLGMPELGTFEKGKKPGVVWIDNVNTEDLELLPGSDSHILIPA